MLMKPSSGTQKRLISESLTFIYSLLHLYRRFGQDLLAPLVGFYASFPWQCLYFFPLPHGHGSFLPIFGAAFTGACFTATSSPPPPGSNLSRSLAPYSWPARSTASLLAWSFERSVFSWRPSL